MADDRMTAIPPRAPTGADAKVLSRAESEALFRRIVALTTAGGETQVTVRSDWAATLGWAQNRPTHATTATRQRVNIWRLVQGREAQTEVTGLDDATLRAAVQEVEQRVASPAAASGAPATSPVPPVPGLSTGAPVGLPPLLGPQQYVTPRLWDDATAQMTMHELSERVRNTVTPVSADQRVAAGQAAVSAASWAIFNTAGLAAYSAITGALYSESVRTPDGSAVGWAGKTHHDWSQLDIPALATQALQQCRDDANPVAVEPGRYTTILTPQAVQGLMFYFIEKMDREIAEVGETVFTLTPSAKQGERGVSKLGHPIIDHRLTIETDPLDPECGYIPFDQDGNPYHPVTWVEQGILKALPYGRGYAHRFLGTDVALPNPRAYRMSGGDTSIEAMIASTERGILVTSLHADLEGAPLLVDDTTITLVGATRDALWLVERGRISHPIKALWFRIELMEILNRVLQIGPAVRTYGSYMRDPFQEHGVALEYLPAQAVNEGHMPVVAPALKVEDFTFTRLADAI